MDQIVQRAWTLLEPELREQGYELVEVEYTGPGGRPAFRVFIDKPGGVTLDDCTRVSQFLNPYLDVNNLVPGSYMLEVSSPGIARPLRKAADFQRFIGEPVRIKSRTPVTGRKQFRGQLTGFDEGLLTVKCEGTEYHIHVENVHKANLDR